MPNGRLKETLTRRPHPGGRKGAMLSLAEVAKRAWAARADPRVRALALGWLQDAGYPQSRREQVQTIVDGFRRKAGAYVPDPFMVEFMASPVQTLCLDEHGLCLAGYDCDDATISCLALCYAIGLQRLWAVAASYGRPGDDPNTPTHVYFAFADERGNKIRADATGTEPVGTVVRFVKEWWVDPSEGAVRDLENGLSGGEFVGIAGRPALAAAAADEWGALWLGGRPVVGLGLTLPHEVYEYRRIWEPYVAGTVDALRLCSDAIQTQSDSIATSDPSRATTLKLYADGARQNADFLASEWNAYRDTSAANVMLGAADILLFFQRTVLQAGTYAQSSGADCPGVPFPPPTPLEEQNSVILALQDAQVIGAGSLQLLAIGASGALQAVGAAVRTVTHPIADLAKAANSPWPWVALTAAAAAVIVFEVWPKRRAA